jgi:ubiquinone/menaquinone biosynthesis C-methylase UbiE
MVNQTQSFGGTTYPEDDKPTFITGLRRYQLAVEQMKVNGRVLDVACGAGYGTALLASKGAKMAIGVDLSIEALRYCQQKYCDYGTYFALMDARHLAFPDHSFDTVVSLETIEHIPDPNTFLSEIARVCTDSGLVIISTPNAQRSLEEGRSNPYHVREFSLTELRELLEQWFDEVIIWGQELSPQYQQRINQYPESVREAKAAKGKVFQWLLHHVYKPIKVLVPRKIERYCMEKILRVSFPIPDPEDDVIFRRENLHRAMWFVALCARSCKAEVS